MTSTVTTPVLALTPEDRTRAGELLRTLLDDYERGLPSAPLVPELDDKVLTDLLSTPISREGIGVEGVFAEIRDKIIANSTALASPRFLAYVSGPPNGIAPYAEAIAATINQNVNFWQLGPAASVVERAVLRWLAGLVGYPADAGGILTGGGSIATLNGLATALLAGERQRPSGDSRVRHQLPHHPGGHRPAGGPTVRTRLTAQPASAVRSSSSLAASQVGVGKPPCRKANQPRVRSTL
jgi:hypothetical protein